MNDNPKNLARALELQETLCSSLQEELRLSYIYVYSDDITVNISVFSSIITDLDARVTIMHEWMSEELMNAVIGVLDVTSNNMISWRPIIKVEQVPGVCQTIGWEFKIERDVPVRINL